MGEPLTSDPVDIPGPWQHRYIAANGARFHVAEAGREDAPLVVLLHGFPQMWWAWRHQVPALADAGFRAVAMDLRGYGGSDTTPRGYDALTLAQDVASVIKALGADDATVVGQGWGGYVGWTAAALHPREVSALAAVTAPHPLAMLRSPSRPALRHLLAAQLPLWPERRLTRASTIERHLRAWRATPPAAEEVDTYHRAMSRWPSSHCALEYHRWVLRSRVRADGRAFDRAVRRPLEQPVLGVAGGDDVVVPEKALARSASYVDGPFELVRLPGVGHFPHEEDPVALTEVLLRWLPR